MSLEEVLARVRGAIGASEPREGEDILVQGLAEHHGSSGTFTWRFGHGARFVRRIEAARVRAEGVSEHGVWTHDGGVPAREMEWGEADEARLVSAVLGGGWLAEHSRVDVGLLSDGRLRLTLGRGEGILALDPDTFEPRELTVRSSFAAPTWTFSDYGRFRHAGHAFPARVEQNLPAGVVNRFDVSSVAGEPADASAFAAPRGNTSTRFDSGVSPEVHVERSGPGFLLVEPEINGQKIGRFIFDTGAGANVITPEAAARTGLSRIGSSWLGLAAGANSGTVRSAGRMRLGPLSIEDPAFTEMDLSPISALYGFEVAGIIGYDVLRRSIVEIEVDAPRVTIFDPASAPDRGDAWRPIVIYRNHVYVRARFEGHEGWFRLDTGAPQVPLILNGPAVSELSLLGGREVTRQTIDVPGGTMEVAVGNVRDFELAGHVFKVLPTIFPTETKGAFADRETIGNLGMAVLSPFRVTFDYRRKRAAFAKRD
jgi:predicted aspartyl protease